MATVELRDVSFTYRRNGHPVIDRVTATIPPGVMGLVGPNGAGKSTLLRIIAKYLRPSSGSVEIISGDAAGPLPLVGLIPETPLFDGHLEVGDFLTGIATLAKLPNPTFRDGLNNIWHTRLSELSLGQKRKVEIAAALIGMPSVLLFDEPTNGLDPFALRDLRGTIDMCNDGKRAIVVSSHHLDELQRSADSLLVMSAGRMIGVWTREQMAAEHGSIEALFKNRVPQPN